MAQSLDPLSNYTTSVDSTWKNGERELNTSLQMVVLAFLALLLRRL